MDDLTALTVDELHQLQHDVADEIERRDNLTRIPRTVAGLSRAYTASGGDPADLIGALTPEQQAALRR